MQFLTNKRKLSYWVVWTTLFIPLVGNAQINEENTLESATLDNIIQYALDHQPKVQQAQIDEEITEQAIKGKLADWYPQINFNYNYQRNIDLQSSVIGGQVIRFGVNNTSSAQFTATQNIFNKDALLASKTASKVRMQASQNTSRSKIDVVVDVTKAVYDVLATTEQIKVSEESILRLQQSLQDAHNRYVSGVSDKTDYQRATILVRNAEATLKSNSESLIYKKEYLKALMGYPQGQDFSLEYDQELMESQVTLEVKEQVNHSNHIDYQIIQTQRELQEANLKYSQWAFLPSVNLFGAYNLNYQNNKFNDLYGTRYPYSYVGATLSIPLFQGGRRLAKVQEEKWVSSRLDLSLTNLENNLNTAYARAMASYKSNLAMYLAHKENVELAQEVYDIIQLQYTNGVKSYLDVTTSESELRTTRINYFNALYLVLASKVDVQNALGQINY